MADLEGRTALVTGASRGIGQGIALELAARGARVVVNYRRDAEAAAETVGAIETSGGEAIAVQGSMADGNEVDRLAETVLARWGAVDLLVHNAGVASRGQGVADTEPLELERVIATHAIGAHRLTSRLLPTMRSCNRADIIMISSSEVSKMSANGAPYNMAKAALEALALTLAKEEIGYGIRVNIVAPGLVITDMGIRLVRARRHSEDLDQLDAEQPLGRVCRPADVARIVAFLASESAALVTAQRIVIDGGVEFSPAR
jgi:3-oxoacyl-[acyl-carrier protein] reductase